MEETYRTHEKRRDLSNKIFSNNEQKSRDDSKKIQVKQIRYKKNLRRKKRAVINQEGRETKTQL